MLQLQLPEYITLSQKNIDYLHIVLMTDYMLSLNTYLQRNRHLGSASWEFSEAGPQHQLHHLANLKINGQVVATGRGNNRGTAKAEAARIYLTNVGAL
ncbi:unnamed protein product [Peniophora sp. CBMAI 1063]|nr:unnamed protein product [Peniophora sp. CBMAI 1063]